MTDITSKLVEAFPNATEEELDKGARVVMRLQAKSLYELAEELDKFRDEPELPDIQRVAIIATVNYLEQQAELYVLKAELTDTP